MKKKDIQQKKLTDKLKTGDILYVSCADFPLCYHLGIAVKDENGLKIYHNNSDNRNKYGGSLVYQDYEAFTNKRQLIKVIESGVTKEQILYITRKYKTEVYDTFFFNCEDYVLEIVDGHRRSDLRDTFKIAALGILIIILI